MSLFNLIEEFLLERGALKVGVATAETLAGGPPSVDLEYKLKGARAAVSFALPMNRDAIRLFLSKQDRGPHETDNLETNLRSKQLSWELAEMLQREGHQAKGTPANLNYRRDLPGWQLLLHPEISHRYLAARSGVGSYGWSGNVGLKGFGTAIILGTTLTDARLDPTPPVPEAESFCDGCKLCIKACAGEMVDDREAAEITIGGVTFRHGARRSLVICNFVCGGFTGLHKSGKWSTWSPGRFVIPDWRDEKKLTDEFFRAMALYAQRPPMPGGYRNPALGNDVKTYMTCGNCQLVCWGDKQETARNLKLLHTSGCILQRPDGSLYSLPPAEAETAFRGTAEEFRRLYC
jgi:epoxyqueuosine reductase